MFPAEIFNIGVRDQSNPSWVSFAHMILPYIFCLIFLLCLLLGAYFSIIELDSHHQPFTFFSLYFIHPFLSIVWDIIVPFLSKMVMLEMKFFLIKPSQPIWVKYSLLCFSLYLIVASFLFPLEHNLRCSHQIINWLWKFTLLMWSRLFLITII